MKKRIIIAALALATMWTWTPALAYSNVSPKEATIDNASGLGNQAGSIAAGANSAWNPSGNSFIVSPPGAISGSEFVRPHR
jgi:hypothetical protein